MITPKISIITVVYNAKEALEHTLQNLSALKYPNKEIIIIDGGSNDGTRQVIEKYSLEISQWISEPDNGIYDAMNKGLLKASGEYVWFINAGDMVYDEYTLDNIFSTVETLADVYYGDTMIVDSEGNNRGLRRKKLPKKLSWYSLRKGMVVCHQSLIVRRKIAPLYDLSYRFAADIEWVIKSLKAASSVHNTHMILSKFEMGGVSTKFRKKSLQERFIIMRNNYGYFITIFYHIVFVFELLLKPKLR